MGAFIAKSFHSPGPLLRVSKDKFYERGLV